MTSCTGGGGGTFGDKEKRRPGKREKRGLAYKHPPFGRLNTQGKVLDALQSFCQLFFECHPNHLHTQKQQQQKKKERLNTQKIPGICTQKQQKVREDTK